MRKAIITRPFFLVLSIFLVYGAMLSMLATFLRDETFQPLFIESGFFEQYSIVAWLVAAVAAMIFSKSQRWHHGAIAMLFVLCAAREADWHKKFTTDGIFKVRYYTNSVAPLAEKMIAAFVLFLFIGLVIYSLYFCVRYFRSSADWRNARVYFAFVGVSLFFVAKVLDRSVALLQQLFQITVSVSWGRYTQAYEEGFELLGPLCFAMAFAWRDAWSKPRMVAK
jgi:hypothetical protein